MRSDEIQTVRRRMRDAGFEIGCLSNQETGEHPQLFFAHTLAVGDLQQLAVQMRKALDHTTAD